MSDVARHALQGGSARCTTARVGRLPCLSETLVHQPETGLGDGRNWTACEIYSCDKKQHGHDYRRDATSLHVGLPPTTALAHNGLVLAIKWPGCPSSLEYVLPELRIINNSVRVDSFDSQAVPFFGRYPAVAYMPFISDRSYTRTSQDWFSYEPLLDTNHHVKLGHPAGHMSGEAPTGLLGKLIYLFCGDSKSQLPVPVSMDHRWPSNLGIPHDTPHTAFDAAFNPRRILLDNGFSMALAVCNLAVRCQRRAFKEPKPSSHGSR